jgi:phenylalanyl-tRNA synthetase beta chain
VKTEFAFAAASGNLPASQTMKITLNWLKQYVDFDGSPEELAERLTLLGLEVESMTKITGEFEGIVVAQILTRDKVPGADKLSVCKVNDGAGERTIVCGAQNHQPGDKVPLILPNYALPPVPGATTPFVIKERTVFGIVSQGMMCSPKELGLADDAGGLLILRPDAPIGQPFAEYLGRTGGDVVYDLEVTPNRPDLNSVIGIAREVAAATGNPLKLPAVSGREAEIRAEDLVAIRIQAPDLCPRYTARVVRGVKVGPSPDWLRHTLEKVGIRSINNVVDVTNFVMLEIGQPLHAFDYHLIAKTAGDRPTIVIRRAQAGERFVTLDDQERTLTEDMLLIADEQKGIALAGVMGGLNTEIKADTVDVLIESAYFHPPNVRRTSKALGLRTDASYRFERGADIEIHDWASRRAAQLILETAGGQLAAGMVDAYPQPAPRREIALRFPKTDALLGVTIPPELQVEFLRRLGLGVVVPPGIAPQSGRRMPHTTVFQIPSWRVDLKRETDLIEEIERLYGVDKVPPTPPRGAIGANPFDAVHDQIAEVRRLLTGLGLNEAQGQTLISDTAAQRVVPAENLVRLANPLSSDMNTLRPSLLPGLIDSLRHNVSHKNDEVALFEVGRIFQARTAADGPAPDKAAAKRHVLGEERRVAIALTGRRQPVFWSGGERDAKFDGSDLKGLIEELLEQLGVRGASYARRTGTTALFLESATIHLGKQPLGELGLLLPPLAREHDLRDPVWLAELNLDLLIARRAAGKSFQALPAYPAIRRDVAMLVPEAVTHEAVLRVVRQTRPAHLETTELFDVFRGRNIPAGQKSLAYAFTYRSGEKTLTDTEVNAAHEKLVAALKQKLQATVREG